MLYGLVCVRGHIEPEEVAIPYGSFKSDHCVQGLLAGSHFNESVSGRLSRMFEPDYIRSGDETVGGEDAA